MAIYAIGDLHLSGHSDKPMDIFGAQWNDHANKIRDSWLKKVNNDDAVLIPGDISWAMTLEEAMIDLEWIADLPGKKYLIRGNHDYWWGSITKLNSLFDSMSFIQNNFFTYREYAICGTRGWNCPNHYKFTNHDEKIYLREVSRLEMSLNTAKRSGYDNIIVMLHYPPTNDKLEPSLFTEVLEKYNVRHVIYGHLHGETSYGAGLKGIYNGINYYLTSCDYARFEMIEIKG
ncbi:metallophosphoesterase [Alkaliphilus sp. MSJ-5]|uniref:Metallophosphoesterase n=1 Tax=Alkaliphilus flagellatus TaxID=2841507 RepID=A0ABS6G0U0_9FIRM|nr:metallophosphoesterase [Alkaliphilus flagellatus]MBU5675253.1 metallophosphoesterase [Alkaliphilus flagellatus]